MEFRACALAALLLTETLTGCATGQYRPLGEAAKEAVEQLDDYLHRRCAELTLRKGYDSFHLAGRSDVLGLSRRTAMTVTLYKGLKPARVADLYDAKAVLARSASVSKTD